MARFLNHQYPGRKAVLFVLEQATVLVAALFGAAMTAALVAGITPEDRAALPGLIASLGENPLGLQQYSSALLFAFLSGTASRFSLAIPWAIGAAGCCAATLYAADLYDLRRAAADRSSGGRRTLVALGAAGLVLGLIALPSGAEARGAALGAVLAAASAVVLLRAALPAIVGPPTRVLIVGAGVRAKIVAEAVMNEAEPRLELAALLPFESTSDRPNERILSLARRHAADWVVVAPDEARGAIPSHELVRCRLAGITCLTPAMLFERVLRRLPVDDLRASELAYAEGFELSRVHAFCKRALDLFVAASGLLLASPLLLLAVLAIRLDSRGPVLYRQERVGLGGRIFRITKLRTMRVDAEAEGVPQWAREHDARVTWVGALLRKTRIDEIPQLFTVLRGDMSLVGPRPERPFFVEQLRREIPWYGLREAARPGVTGWAQLRYAYGASVADAKAKLEYDLYYVKNGSLFLDLSILFHTVRHVLTGRGAR